MAIFFLSTDNRSLVSLLQARVSYHSSRGKEELISMHLQLVCCHKAQNTFNGNMQPVFWMPMVQISVRWSKFTFHMHFAQASLELFSDWAKWFILHPREAELSSLVKSYIFGLVLAIPFNQLKLSATVLIKTKASEELYWYCVQQVLTICNIIYTCHDPSVTRLGDWYEFLMFKSAQWMVLISSVIGMKSMRIGETK